jgi:hypothetical protein
MNTNTRDYLLASLQGVEDRAIQFDDGQYIDWSCSVDDLQVVECGNEEEAVQLRLTRNDIESLQRALTVWLLNN